MFSRHTGLLGLGGGWAGGRAHGAHPPEASLSLQKTKKPKAAESVSAPGVSEGERLGQMGIAVHGLEGLSLGDSGLFLLSLYRILRDIKSEDREA